MDYAVAVLCCVLGKHLPVSRSFSLLYLPFARTLNSFLPCGGCNCNMEIDVHQSAAAAGVGVY